MLDEEPQLFMKGNNHSYVFFNDEFLLVGKQYLRCGKFWIGYNGRSRKIDIYEVATNQMHQVLHFPYFDILGIEWNKEQSSFIVFDKTKRQYCVIKRV